MFKVTKRGDNRLDIEMSGKLDVDQMRIALDEFASKCQPIEGGRMLYDVVDFHLPSLAAIAVEFSRMPSMLGLIKNFERAAVLADKPWLKAVSEFEGRLIPGLEIKAFDRNQRDEAEAWLAE
jgi:hypothetical protein